MQFGQEDHDALDEKDLRMVDLLVHDPQASIDDMASRLAYAVPTVQRRLLKMIQRGVVERGLYINNWSAIGYPLRYWIDIRVNHRALQQRRGGPPGNREIDTLRKLAHHIMHTSAAQYEGKREIVVQDVTILLGSPADLSVYVRARNHHAVLEFLSRGLGVLGGIDSTQTFHEVWSCAEGKLDE